jgi:hypothetical protein
MLIHTKVGTKVLPPICLSVAPCRLSCLTHQVVTLSSSSRIIDAPVSHMRSTQQQCKMADVVDVRTGQRVVIKFLTSKVFSPIEIHRQLRIMYGEDATNVSSVRCLVRRSKNGEKDVGDRTRSARSVMAA